MIETEVKYLIDKLPINLPNPMYIEQRYFEPVLFDVITILPFIDSNPVSVINVVTNT